MKIRASKKNKGAICHIFFHIFSGRYTPYSRLFHLCTARTQKGAQSSISQLRSPAKVGPTSGPIRLLIVATLVGVLSWDMLY